MPTSQPYRLWLFETLDWNKAKQEFADNEIIYKAYTSPNLNCIKGYIQLNEPQRQSYFSRCPSSSFYHKNLTKNEAEASIIKTHPNFLSDGLTKEHSISRGSMNYGNLHIIRGYDVEASGPGDLTVEGTCEFKNVKIRDGGDIFISNTSILEIMKRIEDLEDNVK